MLTKRTIKHLTSACFWTLLLAAGMLLLNNHAALAGGLLDRMEGDIDTFGNAAGLESGQDPRVTIFRIINIALGILGLVLTILIIYGGFIWMTAAGSEEKVSKAKKILANSTVGIIIIITSYAISTFIFHTIERSVD